METLARESIFEAVTPLCRDVPPDIVQDFLNRMDQEYLRGVEPATIARHIRLAAKLTPEHLCELSIEGRRDQRFELIIVAYDYFAEFAMICGLLSAFGLNIE